ncbi:Accumulation-associated protein [Trichinella sp. T6]|nr:Accumulation-associated protein [Trichinella sp. T6]
MVKLDTWLKAIQICEVGKESSKLEFLGSFTTPAAAAAQYWASGPGAPAGPGGPRLPGFPFLPGGPGGPAGPRSPRIPGIPSFPRRPKGPRGPFLPGGPLQPGRPLQKTHPGRPGSPGYPGNPTNPGSPFFPTHPGGPGNPGFPHFDFISKREHYIQWLTGHPLLPGGPGGPLGPGGHTRQHFFFCACILSMSTDPGGPTSPFIPGLPGAPCSPDMPGGPGGPLGQVQSAIHSQIPISGCDCRLFLDVNLISPITFSYKPLTVITHPVLLKLGKTCPLHLISLTLEACPISNLLVSFGQMQQNNYIRSNFLANVPELHCSNKMTISKKINETLSGFSSTFLSLILYQKRILNFSCENMNDTMVFSAPIFVETMVCCKMFCNERLCSKLVAL